MLRSLLALALALNAASGCGDEAADPDDGDDDGDAIAHPFGTHGGYADGMIQPDRDPSSLDAETAAFYDAWKERYLEPACQPGHLRVAYATDGDRRTVSEAMGYGMLIAVLVAGHDPGAREAFDGLWAYVVDHPTAENADLLAWAQDDACQDVEGSDSATDGDIDIAYALLLADAQWGSDGGVDYAAAADARIAAILEAEVHPTADTILLGDWANDPAFLDGTRLSDQMPSHFKAFAAATGVDRWDAVSDRSYDLIAVLQDEYAPDTGLLPDFAVGADGASPAPAPAGYLESADDGAYSYNACRAPWRLATDVLLSGDERALTAVRAMNAWVRAETGDDPSRIRAGYALDGTPLADFSSMAFTAPFAVAAMVEPSEGTNQPWLDAVWDAMLAAEPDGYYEDTLQLLAMLVVSDNWWAP